MKLVNFGSNSLGVLKRHRFPGTAPPRLPWCLHNRDILWHHISHDIPINSPTIIPLDNQINVSGVCHDLLNSIDVQSKHPPVYANSSSKIMSTPHNFGWVKTHSKPILEKQGFPFTTLANWRNSGKWPALVWFFQWKWWCFIALYTFAIEVNLHFPMVFP